LIGHTNSVSSVAFSPDGKSWPPAATTHIDLWDLSGVLSMRGHAAEIACARSGGGFSPEEWNRAVSNLTYEPSCSVGWS
jgi:WD40 repeat protein